MLSFHLNIGVILLILKGPAQTSFSMKLFLITLSPNLLPPKSVLWGPYTYKHNNITMICQSFLIQHRFFWSQKLTLLLQSANAVSIHWFELKQIFTNLKWITYLSTVNKKTIFKQKTFDSGPHKFWLTVNTLVSWWPSLFP